MEVEQPESAISRPYRSKRQRPCDLCRVRKVGCQIEGNGPCFLCRKNGVHCSYDMQPIKRQRVDDDPLSAAQSNDEAIIDQRAGAQQPSPGNDNIATPRTDFSQYLRDWQPEHGEATPSGDLMMLMAADPEPSVAPLPDLVSDDQPWLQDWLAAEGIALNPAFEQDYRPSDSELVPDGTYLAVTQPSLIAVGDDVRQPLTVPSLDSLPGTSAQYLGFSGHTDPYLLRHFRWDEEHQRKYFKMHFRRANMQTGIPPVPKMLNSPTDQSDFDHAPSHNNAVGETSHDGVPVQFALPVTDITEAEKRDTMFRQDASSPETLRKELFELIGPADGIRLIDLHFRFVYPWFPAASKRSIGSETDLDTVPTHLLAAIYASALPFVHHDHHLFVQNVYQKPPIDEVWHIVLEEVLREMHTPHLSVLQASLLYLQKLPRSSRAGQDTPFRWSFMASVYAMACALGVHLDCLDWTIPPWEIRLRRRLWWLVFFEEKWRSLLLGQPSLIDDDYWDVSDLQDDDFADEERSTPPALDENTAGDNSSTKFRLLVDLSKLAGAILRSFYTLRATRRLQNDFSSSLQAAKPLRQSLQAWYQDLPADLQMNKRNGSGESLQQDLGSIAAFHLAYLSLELLLYRAILRPLGRHRKSEGSDIAGATLSVGSATPSVTQPWLDQNLGDLKEAMSVTYAAAYNCARLWNNFAASLDANDFGGFWYSWSRIGFAHQSNFVALLIAQSYTDDMKRDALKIADTWRNTLRVQSKSFDQMSLGMLRLEVMYWVGFDKLFADDG